MSRFSSFYHVPAYEVDKNGLRRVGKEVRPAFVVPTQPSAILTKETSWHAMLDPRSIATTQRNRGDCASKCEGDSTGHAQARATSCGGWGQARGAGVGVAGRRRALTDSTCVCDGRSIHRRV